MACGRKILHVDDDSIFARFLKAVLSQQGYEVESLQDPQRCVDALMAGQHPVVILDVDMPGMNGLDLLRSVKRMDEARQVIMVSGGMGHDDMMAAIRGGASSCFSKPLDDYALLLNAVSAAFDKSRRFRNLAASTPI